MHSADTSKLFWIRPGRLRREMELLDHLEFGWVAFPDVASLTEASVREVALQQRRAPGVLATLLQNGSDLDPRLTRLTRRRGPHT